MLIVEPLQNVKSIFRVFESARGPFDQMTKTIGNMATLNLILHVITNMKFGDSIKISLLLHDIFCVISY